MALSSRATAAAVSFFLAALLPGAVLLVVYCARRQRNRIARVEGAASVQGILEAQARLLLRGRVTFVAVSFGWPLMVLGWAPGLTRQVGGWKLAVELFGYGAHLYFLLAVTPGACIMLLGVFPTDARAVRILACFLPFLCVIVITIGALTVIGAASGSWSQPEQERARVFVFIRSVIDTAVGLAFLMYTGRLCMRRHALPSPVLLEKEWRASLGVVGFSGVVFSLTAVVRTAMDIRMWYDDKVLFGDVALGATQLITAALLSPAQVRMRIARALAFYCESRHEAANLYRAAEEVGLCAGDAV